jgi:hypothetical protein
MWIGIPAVGETAARMATCDDERRGGAGGTNVREFLLRQVSTVISG